MKIWHKPFKGFMAYEWQIGYTVFQFCHNDKWNWREYATFWRFNVWRTR
jgi:hypothetical protein